MAAFDHLAYIFALIIHAPLPVEAAVVIPPPEALAAHYNSTPRAATILTQPLPPLDHDDLPKLKVLEVRYAPGESSQTNSPSCLVVGYVLEGAVRMQIKGRVERTYGAGESFYEALNGARLVSANASKTLPARFRATFFCDHEAPVSTPVHASPRGQ